MFLHQEDQHLSPSHDFVGHDALQLGLCTEVAAVGNRAISSDTAWGTPTGICTGQDAHGGVGEDRAEHPLGTPTPPGSRMGVDGVEVPPATSTVTTGHQPGAGARLPQHIQCCLSAWIREQAHERNKNIQVTSNNTITSAFGNYYQLYQGMCAADNSTKEALSWQILAKGQKLGIGWHIWISY